MSMRCSTRSSTAGVRAGASCSVVATNFHKHAIQWSTVKIIKTQKKAARVVDARPIVSCHLCTMREPRTLCHTRARTHDQ